MGLATCYFMIHVISLILLTIPRFIAADFGVKHKVVADIVTSHNMPTSVLLYSCHQKQFELRLAKELNQTKRFKLLQDVKTIQRRDLVNNARSLLFVVDLTCPGVQKFLKQSAALKLYSAPYRWLLLDRAGEQHVVSTVLGGLFFPADSEALLVRETDNSCYKINLIYKIHDNDEWRLELYGYWTLKHGLQKSTLIEVAAVRRRNLRGHQISIGWVVTDNTTLYKYIDKQDPEIDRVTKVNMAAGDFIIDFVNASRKDIITETWGSQRNNSWNGLTGYLERGEIDIGGTPMFVVPERLLFVQFIARPTKDGTAFVFLQPPLSSTSNIFLLSFQENLWYGSLVLLCILFFILYMMAMWEWKQKEIKSSNDDENDLLRPNVSDVGLVIVGATCQQGSSVELKGPSGRMVLLLLFVAVMFLYTSFSANIVALLQSSSLQIKTLQDLLNSKLKFGIEDYKWIQRYFEMEKEPVRKALYQKKIAPHGDIQNFLSLERGVKEMKKGQFAFHMQLGVGYRAVGRYLEEHEKCNLEEIPYLRVVDPHIAVRKGSPFLEMYNIGYKRLQEHGLQTRENLLMYTKKPKCSGSKANFVSVSLVDCSPAFVVLASGVTVAVLLCIIENIYSTVKTVYNHETHRNREKSGYLYQIMLRDNRCKN